MLMIDFHWIHTYNRHYIAIPPIRNPLPNEVEIAVGIRSWKGLNHLFPFERK